MKRFCVQNCSGKAGDGRCDLAGECPLFELDGEKELAGLKTAKRDEVPTEAEEQIALNEWCEAHGIRMVHIPNERKASAVAIFGLFRQGMKKGFPDNFFPYPRGEYHGLFIELKRAKRSLSRESEEQREWVDFLNAQGYKAVFTFGAKAAEEEIKKYLKE